MSTTTDTARSAASDRTGAVSPAAAVLLAVVAAWLLLLLAIALLVPYHGTDALVYGSWSEDIADLGSLRTPGAGNALLHRPLFYGGQGLLWHLFGIHEWIGRLWSWLFLAVFLAALTRLALGRARDWLNAGAAGVLALAIPDAQVQAAAGQTDMPVAALVTLSAALVWAVRRSPWRIAGIVVAVAAAALTKPSAIPALPGLLAATAIGRRASLRGRLLHDALPIAGGLALALVYHVIQSRYLHQSLYDFLAGATEDPRAVAAVNTAVADTYAEARRTIVVAAQWLGPYLALLLIFSVTYAVQRLCGVAHRRAATIALPLAVVLAWVLPYIGQSGARSVRVGPLDTGQPAAIVAYLATIWICWLFARAAEPRIPSVVHQARMLVWALPMVLAWIRLNPSETRYLSAAWAPLILLMAPVVSEALRAARARGALALAAAAAIPLFLFVANLRNVDGLGTRPDGTYNAARVIGDASLSDLGHPERMRALADPQLAGLLEASRAAAGPDGRLLTNDGRMIFFFRDRMTNRAPARCSDLRGYDAVGLITNAAPPAVDLARCGARPVGGVPGSYVVFATGTGSGSGSG